ncbi:MAG: hypothetical protein M1324_03875 [Patescibacteria group bacterium]|nr:hypothetical protein [Patescibacteria group bacterium]
MKEESRKKFKNFTLEVIDLFLGIPESIVYSFDRKEFYRILQGMPTEKVLTCSNISHIISNFKKNGYIETIKNSNGQSIQFTKKAKLAIIDQLAKKSEDDRGYRFVSFDIPETMRKNRNQFRRTIKRMGFRQIQKSLWVCNKNVGNLIELAAIEYNVNDYVVYIASDSSNIDEYIRKVL